MFLRLALSSLLACGLIAAQLSAGAEAASRGVLKGKTSQGYRIKLRMHGDDAFKLLRFKADLNCRDGSQLQLIESGFLPTRVRKGSFHDAQFGRTDTVRFRGRANRKVIRGRMRLEDKFGKKRIRCKSRWIRFHVKR